MSKHQSPADFLRRIARDTRSPYPVLRSAVLTIDESDRCRAWAELSHYECDRLWEICRRGRDRAFLRING